MVRIVLARMVLLAAAICLSAPGTLAANDWRSLECDPSAELGSWSCAATACHGGSGEQRRSGGELEIWRNSDPHASAGSLIETSAFAEILLRLNIVTALGTDTRPGKRVALLTERSAAKIQECMNCHNPRNVPTSWTPLEASPDTVSIDNMSDGFAISCETCHGAAKDWIGKHYRRDFAREEHGFHDLKNLVIRGRTCAQCHIGDEQRDMNHDMIAAGHPPLRFELASYQRALPKHWNDSRQRANTRDYELKLWLAGQIANFDMGLNLLESRLDRSQGKEVIDDASGRHARPIAPWPEFAEANCSSCHQRLQAATESVGAGVSYKSLEVNITQKGWNCGFLPELEELDRPTGSVELSMLRPQFRNLVDERYRGVFTPSGSVPADVLKKFPVVANQDQQLQLYALLLATAKTEYDKQLKSGGTAMPPSALVELIRLRAVLSPRPATSEAEPIHTPPDELRWLFESAATKLQKGLVQ